MKPEQLPQKRGIKTVKKLQRIFRDETSVTTAGEAKKLKVDVDRTKITANGEDLSYLTVCVTYDKGNLYRMRIIR